MKKNSYVQDINGHNLYENDYVYYVVKRCSPTYSNWCQITNPNEGYFKIKGKITFQKNVFDIVGDYDEIKALKKPVGREQFERVILNETILLSEYVSAGYYLGKNFKHGYIEKITNRKNKKKILTRLQALGLQ